MTETGPIAMTVEEGVARCVIDHPPINLLDTALIRAIAAVADRIEKDEAIRVCLFESADPEFFVAHGDVNSILRAAQSGERSDSVPFQLLLERFRTLPKVSIGKVDGIARGGGAELLAALDMRFGSLENTRLAQPEVALGIIPGGGGTARWPRHIGYARALELIAGCQDIDGATAERYGMLNRALPKVELDDFVDTLARRIARYPVDAIAAAKAVARNEGTLAEALSAEAFAYSDSAAHPDAQSPLRNFMASGGQTREVERDDPFADLRD